MQLLIICGCKFMPWTKSRQKMITFFLSMDLFPSNPFRALFPSPVNNSSMVSPPEHPLHVQDGSLPNQSLQRQPTEKNRKSRYERGFLTTQRGKRILTDGRTFWRYILYHADKNRISLHDLISVIIGFKKTAKRNLLTYTRVKYVKDVINGLFTNRPENFSTEIAVSCKTGNTNDVITALRRFLRIRSTKCNVIPSVRDIQESSGKVMRKFISICQPELTFSGFRCNLVNSVKFVAFILFGKDKIEDLYVDIWGDGCEIGGIDMTRLCFRILKDFNEKITAQSSKTTFCFCGECDFFFTILLIPGNFLQFGLIWHHGFCLIFPTFYASKCYCCFVV